MVLSLTKIKIQAFRAKKRSIGSGIAGLTFALKVAKFGKVCIVTKSKMEDTATSYAQGGIAAVMYTPDSYEKHIRDTIVAGDGLCDENIVRICISESTERIDRLVVGELLVSRRAWQDRQADAGQCPPSALGQRQARRREWLRLRVHRRKGALTCPRVESAWE